MILLTLSLVVLSISLIFFQSKYFLLIDRPLGQKHKLDFNKNTPLSGGIYFFITLSLGILLPKYNGLNLVFIFFLLLFLILGIYSDLKPNFSAKKRLFLQSIIVFLIIYFLDVKIYRTNIPIFDLLIDNYVLNLLFTFLCILVFLNGSNFCDGVNCNVVGYYLLIFLAINYSGLPTPYIYFDTNKIIVIFSIFYLFNLMGKFFLGDNGTYVISIFMSIYIIQFININDNISALLAVNLLWYPAFENLFSILRRIFSKKKIQAADRNHLHILLFDFIVSKINIKISNSLTGLILNIFMSIGIFFSVSYNLQNKILLSILIVNISIYTLIYFGLMKRNFYYIK